MIVALLMTLVVILYLLFFAGALALELGIAALFLLWPVLLPIGIGWKLILIGIWLFIFARYERQIIAKKAFLKSDQRGSLFCGVTQWSLLKPLFFVQNGLFFGQNGLKRG